VDPILRAVQFTDRLSFVPDYPDPAPGSDDVLIQPHLAGICATDLEITKGYMGFQGVLGHEFVGTVVKGPPPWQDKRVVAEINCVCGKCDLCAAGLSTHCRRRTVIGIDRHDGAFADWITVPVRNLHLVPDAVSDEQAVFVEPLAAAIQVIKQVPIESRMKVAVIGSGRLGLLVAQVLAATRCKLELIGRNPNSLLFGEKKGIQSTEIQNLVRRPDRDVVVECTGHPDGLKLANALIRPRGTIVLKSTYAVSQPMNLAPLVINEINLVGSRCGPFPEALAALAAKKVDVQSMISKQFPLDQAEQAFAAAQDPGNIKVFLRIKP
jgi:alcohol dehydrogenase